MSDSAVFRLFQLVSPALPVGAFAYSQGLEMAVERELITDESSTAEWLKGLISNNLAYLELPILIRCYQSIALENSNKEDFEHWNNHILAARETKELYQESTLMAQALLRLLKDLNVAVNDLPKPLDWVSAFAFTALTWDISLEQALQGYAWSWLENQIAAAIKLVPLGQTQGQRLLIELSAQMSIAIDTANACQDTELGRMSPMQTMMSALHETQYSRLFRS